MDLRNDGFVAEFTSERDFIDFVEDVNGNDIWKDVEIREIQAEAMKNAPLLVDQEKLSRGIRASNEAIEDTMQNTQMVLRMEGQTELLRESAIAGLFSRAGLAGRSLRDFRKQGKEGWLSEVVNICLFLYESDTARVLIRGEKVSAVQSRQYLPIPQRDVFTGLGEWLWREQEMKFKNSCFCHTMTEAVYSGYVDTGIYPELEAFGILVIGKSAKVYTGDTGTAAVRIFPSLTLIMGTEEHTLPCGKDIRYIHLGKPDTSDPVGEIKENLKMNFFQILSDGVDRMIELASIAISDPLATWDRLSEKEMKLLPAKQTREEVADRCLDVVTMSALDMIVAMQTVAEKMPTMQSRIDAEEAIMRLVARDYDWH